MCRLRCPAPGMLLSALLIALAGACAKARPAETGTQRCLSWKEDIGPVFAQRCAGCHGGATPAAGYDLTSYNGALGGGSDALPDAIAGDADSTLVRTLDPSSADATHQAFGDVFPQAQRWVVECNLSFSRSTTATVHAGGILNPASPDFHGQLLRDKKYDFGLCGKCHGDNFAGGTSKVSCLSCHKEGPTACSTCHGDLAGSAKPGSHAHHLGAGPLGKSFACQECHKTPKVYTDVGHILLADGSLDPAPAEVTLGATAALTPPGTTRAAPPAYDPATGTCSNIYCHGAVLTDSAATNTQPGWKAPGQNQAACGTCHGLPPNHANGTACAMCHPAVVDRDQKVISAALHINGKVDFGLPDAGCAGCHGSKLSAAPPPDLMGNTAPSAPGVGAHQAHVTGASHLRGPIACAECHRVPAQVDSPGHIGGHAPGDDVYPAEVFPADPTVGAVATSDGAMPAYDRQTATCAGVYCHGGGAKLSGDATADLDRTPVWTSASAGASGNGMTGLTCGSSCHGAPPTLPPHLPTMTRLDCAVCHPRTVDAAGNIIISGPTGAETSAHINGAIDVAL